MSRFRWNFNHGSLLGLCFLQIENSVMKAQSDIFVKNIPSYYLLIQHFKRPTQRGQILTDKFINLTLFIFISFRLLIPLQVMNYSLLVILLFKMNLHSFRCRSLQNISIFSILLYLYLKCNLQTSYNRLFDRMLQILSNCCVMFIQHIKS